jgi:hypothetical protein
MCQLPAGSWMTSDSAFEIWRIDNRFGAVQIAADAVWSAAVWGSSVVANVLAVVMCTLPLLTVVRTIIRP